MRAAHSYFYTCDIALLIELLSSQAVSMGTQLRRRSSVDELQMLMTMKEKEGRRKKEFAVRPLLKRNTIADFATSKTFQGSTASLLSAGDQVLEKKSKNAFSFLKLIDKKCHRSKDDYKDLNEVLNSLKPSEFKDYHLNTYKNMHWTDLMEMQPSTSTGATNNNNNKPKKLVVNEMERKRREAVWELFRSECVFLIDHLMVLKHCFMEPMKKVQVEGHLMFTEPHQLFGNLDELCYVSYTFSKDFISLLLKDFDPLEFGKTEILMRALKRFCQLTRDGEVYHDYCLNYSKSTNYLEQLRKNEDFNEFEKWCNQDERCRRLQLTDLLISPLQHCTKVPLLLHNIRRYTASSNDQQWLSETLSKLESSLVNLETKMVCLTNYERIQEIQHQIVWQPITELEPRAYIPDFLRCTLSRQPCEKLLTCTSRKLIYEGFVNLLEISKAITMYMFLFDDILLLTKIKKSNRRVLPRNCAACSIDTSSTSSTKLPNEGSVFVVYRQPLALDRFTVHDVRPPDSPGVQPPVEATFEQPTNGGEASDAGSDATTSHGRDWCIPHLDECNPGSSTQKSSFFFGCVSVSNVLRNAFVLVQVNRFQQIIGVFTIQAHSNVSKTSWLQHIHEAQVNYRETLDNPNLSSATAFADKPPSSPFVQQPSTTASKLFFSSMIGRSQMSMSIAPSVEQLFKAPGIRSREGSRLGTMSSVAKPTCTETISLATSYATKPADSKPHYKRDMKIVITPEQTVYQVVDTKDSRNQMTVPGKCGGVSKWRSVSSDAATVTSPTSESVVRRTSDPISTSPSNQLDQQQQQQLCFEHEQPHEQPQQEESMLHQHQHRIIYHKPQIHHEDVPMPPSLSPGMLSLGLNQQLTAHSYQHLAQLNYHHQQHQQQQFNLLYQQQLYQQQQQYVLQQRLQQSRYPSVPKNLEYSQSFDHMTYGASPILHPSSMFNLPNISSSTNFSIYNAPNSSINLNQQDLAEFEREQLKKTSATMATSTNNSTLFPYAVSNTTPTTAAAAVPFSPTIKPPPSLSAQMLTSSPSFMTSASPSHLPPHLHRPPSSSLKLPHDEEVVRHSSLRVRRRPSPGVIGLKYNIEKSQSSDVIHL
ncbi:hypothetical protein HELRODRAFT_175167 [Helobdella robusta]|uniref:DH domain-containing protein n=1 Tax=Helobdella robusta TaxID=6412 RepID=T1F8Y3_HELRO|nr:hypothetical protein HELRODRAFT_175167 [Helobdella robusta]ESO01138.1 hypothetical protein HELRODRAFT_175167 [Helobdella robusta]